MFPGSGALGATGRTDELDDRSGSALGQSAQLSLSWSGDTQLVVVCGVAHVAGNRPLSSSPVT